MRAQGGVYCKSACGTSLGDEGRKSKLVLLRGCKSECLVDGGTGADSRSVSERVWMHDVGQNGDSGGASVLVNRACHCSVRNPGDGARVATSPIYIDSQISFLGSYACV